MLNAKIAVAALCLVGFLGGPLPAAPGSHLPYGALDQYFGNVRGTYTERNALIADQVGLAMSTPYDDERLPSGDFIVSGCRSHECFLKGVAVVTPSGSIRVAGLIYYLCALATECDVHYLRLAVF